MPITFFNGSTTTIDWGQEVEFLPTPGPQGRRSSVGRLPTLQAAARDQNLPAFAATVLTKALGDPGNPYPTVAVMLNCDDPAWPQRGPGTATRHRGPATRHRGPGTRPARRGRDTLTPQQIMAANTAADRAVLDVVSTVWLGTDAVQATIRADNRADFAGVFEASMAAAITRLDTPSAGENLIRLYADEGFRTDLTNLVTVRR